MPSVIDRLTCLIFGHNPDHGKVSGYDDEGVICWRCEHPVGKKY